MRREKFPRYNSPGPQKNDDNSGDSLIAKWFWICFYSIVILWELGNGLIFNFTATLEDISNDLRSSPTPDGIRGRTFPCKTEGQRLDFDDLDTYPPESDTYLPKSDGYSNDF